MSRFKAADRILNGNVSTTNRIAVADGGRGGIVIERARLTFGDAESLANNLETVRRLEAGESVTAPAIPSGYPDPARLVTENCVRAD
jgi:hypothetical protein